MRLTLPPKLGSVSIDGGKIGLFQVWVVTQDLILGHTGGEHIENVPAGYAQVTDARLPGALARHNADPGQIRLFCGGHKRIIADFVRR